MSQRECYNFDPGSVLISRSASRHQPGREGRKAQRTYWHIGIPTNLLMGNYCEQAVHSRYVQLGLQPIAHSRPTVVGPTGRQGPSGRSPAVGTYEGWVTSYGVCGHFLDSLSACDHSTTLMNAGQARFGRLYVRMFFRKALPQTEGRRNADLLIKT